MFISLKYSLESPSSSSSSLEEDDEEDDEEESDSESESEAIALSAVNSDAVLELSKSSAPSVSMGTPELSDMPSTNLALSKPLTSSLKQKIFKL